MSHRLPGREKVSASCRPLYFSLPGQLLGPLWKVDPQHSINNPQMAHLWLHHDSTSEYFTMLWHYTCWLSIAKEKPLSFVDAYCISRKTSQGIEVSWCVPTSFIPMCSLNDQQNLTWIWGPISYKNEQLFQSYEEEAASQTENWNSDGGTREKGNSSSLLSFILSGDPSELSRG